MNHFPAGCSHLFRCLWCYFLLLRLLSVPLRLFRCLHLLRRLLSVPLRLFRFLHLFRHLISDSLRLCCCFLFRCWMNHFPAGCSHLFRCLWFHFPLPRSLAGCSRLYCCLWCHFPLLRLLFRSLTGCWPYCRQMDIFPVFRFLLTHLQTGRCPAGCFQMNCCWMDVSRMLHYLTGHLIQHSRTAHPKIRHRQTDVRPMYWHPAGSHQTARFLTGRPRTARFRLFLPRMYCRQHGCFLLLRRQMAVLADLRCLCNSM